MSFESNRGNGIEINYQLKLDCFVWATVIACRPLIGRIGDQVIVIGAMQQVKLLCLTVLIHFRCAHIPYHSVI